MKYSNSRVEAALVANERLPRKIKKAVLGRRMTKSQLKRHYRDSVIFIHRHPLAAKMNVDIVCPKCGCLYSFTRHDSIDHSAISLNCCRCDFREETYEGGYMVFYYYLDFVEKHNITVINLRGREKYTAELMKAEMRMRPNKNISMHDLPIFHNIL